MNVRDQPTLDWLFYIGVNNNHFRRAALKRDNVFFVLKHLYKTIFTINSWENPTGKTSNRESILSNKLLTQKELSSYSVLNKNIFFTFVQMRF